MSLTANCSFDLNVSSDYKGKRTGYIQIGDSTNNSGWANHCVPITSIKNGSGPRVLVLAGNHGDEYEGQTAALDLARRVEVADIKGELIIIPVLSLHASAAGTRLWPTGQNFNRIFPGKVDGTVAEKLAFFLSQDLFPTCDSVVDMHSGGRSMYFIPSTTMAWVSRVDLRDEMIRQNLLWKTEFNMIGGEQPSTNPDSLLPGDVIRQGKGIATGEFGGSGVTTAQSMAVINNGLENYLRGMGVYVGKDSSASDRAESTEKATKIIDFIDPLSFSTALCDGIYENRVDLHEHVKAGDVVGLIHNFKSADNEVVEVLARRSGMVALIRGYSPVTTGDVVCTVGELFPNIEAFEKSIQGRSAR
jgi:N-alpha-acetyl-L-2,4-diaminobutyrate deacetylase